MAKTKITKKLESMLEAKFDKRSEFYVFECTYGWAGNEIVDCIMYNTERIVHCYELKQTVSDFHSKAKISFFGHKNYYVMPYSLYEKVKDEIPSEIGCYVLCTRTPKEETTVNEYGISNTKHYMEITNGEKELFCIKPARRLELKCDREILLSSMLRSISNETNMMVRDHYEHQRCSMETLERRVDNQSRELSKNNIYICNLEITLNNVFEEMLGENATHESKRELLQKYSSKTINDMESLEYKALYLEEHKK